MSDTAEMVRLMQHAAELLEDAVTVSSNSQIVAACAYGAAILQMVAASVTPSPTVAPIDYEEYDGWRLANGRTMMSPGELDAINEFMRSRNA